MKKIVLLASIIISTLLMTSCYTNVIELNGGSGGNGGNGGGGVEDNNELIISDRAQLEQNIFAENQICKVHFTSRNGWQLQFENSDQEKWITISESYSEVGGTFVLLINVGENATGLDRTAAIQLISNNEFERIIISQQPQYKDGTRPEPYEKDVFTDMVDRIVQMVYLNGDLEPQVNEWRFYRNPVDDMVEAAELFQKNDEERIVEQFVVSGDREIDHLYFNRSTSGADNIVFRRHSEVVRNEYGFITKQIIREYDYRNDTNPEPRPLQERYFQYSSFRRVSAIGGDIGSNNYKWIDGNMVEQELEGESNFIKFAYDTQKNDNASVALNSVLVGDMYGAVGQFGKRSRNLLISTTDDQQRKTSFEYSFVEGRVRSITQSFSVDGEFQPTKVVYVIYYTNDML